ncbi:MAG TPA: NADPH:quinone reductase [Verrucomicrobiae bacterium]|nr:NADPH:quinone reductase [Verrucomicrobiae bacterium]
MKAAYITRTGPPEVIEFGDLPDPVPTPTQCRIQVRAVDVNPIDVYWRSGAVSAQMPFPFILGRDLAGVVVECGEQVRHFQVGDRVWCSNLGFAGRPGSFAQFAAVDEEWLHLIPPSVRDEDIVANALSGITTHLGLVSRAQLKAGETLFVNGGSGGVGSCVVQMAKILGARVITTAGSEAKAAICRELGADLVLNYQTQDVDAAVREFAPDGVNVWWETLREPDFDRVVALLAKRGRMVLMAGREARPAFPVGPFYVKDCALHGFAMFNAGAEEQRPAADAINDWMAKGKLKARIDRVLPLAEAAQAHRLQEESTVQKTGVLAGKIVLKP